LSFRSKIIAPPPEAAGLIHTFYIIETDAGRIEEAVPAYSAQLLLLVRGSLTITHFESTAAQAAAVTFNAPQMRSALGELDGPLMLVGASLSHVAWQRLANLPADLVHDRLIPAGEVLPAAQIAELENAIASCRAGQSTPESLCVPLARAVAAGPHALRPDHVAVVEAMLAWLASGFDPGLDALYARVAVSPRQVQRIARRFFGVPPVEALKRFRALRAAILLAHPGLDEALRDEMLASFFDQAHLIRDIRRYTGRTPTQLHRHSLATELLDPSAHGDAGALLRGESD
jgi:AraC-like DNA-binding protein